MTEVAQHFSFLFRQEKILAQIEVGPNDHGPVAQTLPRCQSLPKKSTAKSEAHRDEHLQPDPTSFIYLIIKSLSQKKKVFLKKKNLIIKSNSQKENLIFKRITSL